MFEGDWEDKFKSNDGTRRTYAHKKYPFIKIRCSKIGKGSRWTFELSGWTVGNVGEVLYIERFNINHVYEFFNRVIKSNKTKRVIFNYLFEGKW